MRPIEWNRRRRVALGAAVVVAFGVVVSYRCAHPARVPLRRSHPVPACHSDQECVLWPWLGVVRGVCTDGKCHVAEVPPPAWLANQAGIGRVSCFE